MPDPLGGSGQPATASRCVSTVHCSCGGNCSSGSGVTEQVVCNQTTTQCVCFTYAESDNATTLESEWGSAMAKPVTNIRIPLATNEAISLIARVKPDATMPRPGAQATKAKPKRKRAKK